MKIFLIGPGGVGKSTCGEVLANLLGYNFIDLDTEFCERVENVGAYINNYGYEKYCYENSKLFYEIVNQHLEDFVFSLSSGFLTHENLEDLTLGHKQSLRELGISILLLPSKSLDECTRIVVQRQLSRGFGLKEDREKTKFIQRFPIYKKLGDIKIFSHEKPEIIAEQIQWLLLSFLRTYLLLSSKMSIPVDNPTSIYQ
ncbi:shikimate kinase [Patescibacteria group bacterium]|nr:shikimate kinase [Patescibacteria group bacterium]